jgi:hypothetical protein
MVEDRKLGLLFLGGGTREAIPAMQHALNLGYSVFMVDANNKSEGYAWGKGKIKRATVSSYEYDRILEVAKSRWSGQIDGVIAVGADVGASVSFVADGLGLPHIDFDTALLGWDKVALKEKLAAIGVDVPRAGRRSRDSWIIVKPVYGRGSAGVKRIRPADFSGCDDGEMVERWIRGDQISSESIIYDGKVVFTGITDRYYNNIDMTTPHIVEEGGFAPSRYEGTRHGKWVKDVVQKVVTGLGIRSGTVKGDFVLDEENSRRPVVIEMAIGRMSGGYMCSWYIPKAYGVDFLGAAFAVAVGKSPEEFLVINNTPMMVEGTYDMSTNPTSHKERGEFTRVELGEYLGSFV